MGKLDRITIAMSAMVAASAYGKAWVETPIKSPWSIVFDVLVILMLFGLGARQLILVSKESDDGRNG